MSQDSATSADDRSYGELFGEYVAVVAEIEPLLDQFGRPEPGRHETYARLRERKGELRTALRDEATGRKSTEVESVLDEAFANR